MKPIVRIAAVILLTAVLFFLSCKKEHSCENCGITPPAGGTFKPPIANAGPDQTIMLPIDTAGLDGNASSDPDGTISSYQWTKVSGPATFTINSATTAKITAKQLVMGLYQFELKVTDNDGLAAKDTIQVTVNAPGSECGSDNRPEVTAQLIPIGTLSKARMGMVVASAGNRIIFAGGSQTPDCPECWGSSRVDFYDMVTQSWSIAELSVGRWGIAAVTAGNKVFFAGGEFGDGAFDTYYSTVDIYDASTNTWSVASLSQPRSEIAAAVVGDKIFFAGGEKNADYSTSAVIDIYDIAANRWSVASLSEPRSLISAVTANNKIYFAGGAYQFQWHNAIASKIDIYDNTTGSWSTSSLLEPKAAFAGILFNDKIYWAGGYNGSPGWGLSCTVEVKNINNQASTITNLFKPQSWWNCNGRNAVIKGNKIVFLGDDDKFDIYDISTSNWSRGLLPPGTRGDLSVISVNNTIYVAGGNSNKVWKLEF